MYRYRARNSRNRYKLYAALIICVLMIGLFVFQKMSESAVLSYGQESQELTSKPTTTEQLSNFLCTAYFIDVGQGDSTLFVFDDGKSLLVDAGSFEDRVEVLSTLSSANVDALDCVVATHPHADHIGGMDEVISEYSIKAFYMPDVPEEMIPDEGPYEYLEEAISEYSVDPRSPEQGQIILSGEEYQVQVLSDDSKSYSDLNNYSIVLKVTVDETSFLLTGDAEGIVEDELISSGQNLECDILHCGHHGSSAATTDSFLMAVEPSISVISCGIDNGYGHPHIETLNRLTATNISILRTDQDGDIEVQTDGTSITITKER